MTVVTNLPGSKLLPGIGSYINVVNPLSGNISRLNVAIWDTDEDIHTGPNKADSGSAGYPIRRVTGVDSSISLRIWWDAANCPRDALFVTGGWGCGLQLGLSALANFQAYGYTAQQFYALLSGVVRKFKTHASSEGNDGEDGIITVDAIVQPNATRLFLLPDEQPAFLAEQARLIGLGQLGSAAPIVMQ